MKKILVLSEDKLTKAKKCTIDNDWAEGNIKRYLEAYNSECYRVLFVEIINSLSVMLN